MDPFMLSFSSTVLVGIDAAYVMYPEAGGGFADYACKHMDHYQLRETGLTF